MESEISTAGGGREVVLRPNTNSGEQKDSRNDEEAYASKAKSSQEPTFLPQAANCIVQCVPPLYFL